MIIEWKARGRKTWKRTNALIENSTLASRKKLTLLDRDVLDRAHDAVWRIDGVEYETRATNIPGRWVYVCECVVK